MKKKALLVILMFLTLSVVAINYAFSGPGNLQTPGNKHNLSASQTGVTYQATTETEVCIFCHTPHSAISETPLWNHKLSTATYTWFTSPTYLSPGTNPDWDSKLCLSCHDGTVPLGAVRMLRGSGDQIIYMNQSIGEGNLPAGATNLGTDLNGHHPVSIEYDGNGVGSLYALKQSQCGTVSWKLRDPTVAPVSNTEGLLQPTYNCFGTGCTPETWPNYNKGVQCTSCHDPHYDEGNKFLRFSPASWSTYGDDLCLKCHVAC